MAGTTMPAFRAREIGKEKPWTTVLTPAVSTRMVLVDSLETDQRLDLLHRNILKYGTISNTLAPAVPLEGSLRRKA